MARASGPGLPAIAVAAATLVAVGVLINMAVPSAPGAQLAVSPGCDAAAPSSRTCELEGCGAPAVPPRDALSVCRWGPPGSDGRGKPAGCAYCGADQHCKDKLPAGASATNANQCQSNQVVNGACAWKDVAALGNRGAINEMLVIPLARDLHPVLMDKLRDALRRFTEQTSIAQPENPEDSFFAIRMGLTVKGLELAYDPNKVTATVLARDSTSLLVQLDTGAVTADVKEIDAGVTVFSGWGTLPVGLALAVRGTLHVGNIRATVMVALDGAQANTVTLKGTESAVDNVRIELWPEIPPISPLMVVTFLISTGLTFIGNLFAPIAQSMLLNMVRENLANLNGAVTLPELPPISINGGTLLITYTLATLQFADEQLQAFAPIGFQARLANGTVVAPNIPSPAPPMLLPPHPDLMFSASLGDRTLNNAVAALMPLAVDAPLILPLDETWSDILYLVFGGPWGACEVHLDMTPPVFAFQGGNISASFGVNYGIFSKPDPEDEEKPAWILTVETNVTSAVSVPTYNASAAVIQGLAVLDVSPGPPRVWAEEKEPAELVEWVHSTGIGVIAEAVRTVALPLLNDAIAKTLAGIKLALPPIVGFPTPGRSMAINITRMGGLALPAVRNVSMATLAGAGTLSVSIRGTPPAAMDPSAGPDPEAVLRARAKTEAFIKDFPPLPAGRKVTVLHLGSTLEDFRVEDDFVV